MYQESVSAQAEAESSPALNSGFGEATQTHLVDLRDLLAVQQMDERGARWVNWRAVVNEHKLDKVPVRPNGINADVTRKAHCAPLEACLEAVRRDPSIAGIGYVIAAPRDLEAGLEPIVGIDLDSCRNRETGEIGAWAHEIINAFSSYAEVSPSGTGVKILALVDPSTRLIGGKRVIQTAAGTEHPKQVEVYVDGRFFTITGQILEALIRFRGGKGRPLRPGRQRGCRGAPCPAGGRYGRAGRSRDRRGASPARCRDGDAARSAAGTRSLPSC
jgi:hypothetical protein